MQAFDFRGLFTQELGWDRHQATMDISVDGKTFSLRAVAEKRGLQVFECHVPNAETFPNYALRRKLEDIYKKKMLKRDRRRELGFPIVALAGYTQAGKTSFFNLVAHEEKNVGLGPFTTLTTYARRANTGPALDPLEYIIIDSIGFIEDMHPIILKAFHATLGELATADLMLLFVDASDQMFPLERKVRSCSQILREVDIIAPTIICANKIDLVSPEQLEESKSIIRKYFSAEEVVSVSVRTGENLDTLLGMIRLRLQSQRLIVRQRNPQAPD
jgi:GTP-binding protein HflX